jgi:predicted lipid-binding transport protein (Tim44 family)
MTRSLTGFAVLAVLGILILKVVIAVLGFAMSVMGTLIGLAVVALVVYLILRVISPSVAERVHEAVGHDPQAES